EFETGVDWLGVGYGATPELVEFWAENGFRTVHLSTTRNDASGEYSAVMVDPCSADGRALVRRHTGWFLDRIGSVLSDPLSDLDPDVARAALRAVEGAPELDLSAWDRRLVAGMAGGAAIFDTNPAPVRRLALRHLCAPAEDHDLPDRQERLLVRKVLQGHSWGTVAEELGFHSHSECMRDLGATVERLVGLYCEEATQEELDRHR
ncbi:MAG: GNAT family N-acetyltransferase, partial [Haloarculaceae archaeon]